MSRTRSAKGEDRQGLTSSSSLPHESRVQTSQRHIHHDAKDSKSYNEEFPSQSGKARRGSTASDMLMETIHAVETKISYNLLLSYHELPGWRRDNPAIVSGYRPESNSYLESLHSLFTIHNESVNIWTHLLGSIAFLGMLLYAIHYGWEHVVAPRYETATDADRIVFGCFFLGAVLCMGMSATFHSLNNHSERVQKWGNKLDYSGIVLLIVGSYMPALYYGFFCEQTLMLGYGALICLLGSACMVVSWSEYFRQSAFRAFRASVFVGLGTSGVIPVIHGLVIYGYSLLNQKMGLNWVLLQGGLYIAGAALYATRFPERKWPGKFDIWGNSHNIFHCFVVAAAASHLVGMIKAFDWNHGVMAGGCTS